MESFEQKIKIQRELEKFQVEKSIRGTLAAQIENDIQKGLSEEEIIEKARAGIYINTPENRRKHIVGMKYGSEKKEDKLDLSKHSIQELQDAMRVRVKSGMSETHSEMKQLQRELDNRSKKESKPQSKHIGDMSRSEKISAAKNLGIKNSETLSSKELDKQLVDKNIEKQLSEFKKTNSK